MKLIKKNTHIIKKIYHILFIHWIIRDLYIHDF